MTLDPSTTVGAAVMEVLRREGISTISAYPTTALIDAAATAGIRPVICRQERVGVGIAEGMSWATGGRVPGVFAMQFGPGIENAYSGIASAYSDGTPLLCLPLGHVDDRLDQSRFYSADKLRPVTRSTERLRRPDDVTNVLRRAFSRLRMGAGGPVVVEIPRNLVDEPIGPGVDYRPVTVVRPAPDPGAVSTAADLLLGAERPVLVVGQGVLYAGATDAVVALAELVDAPVASTLEGKSGFPEDHPLALGAGGLTMPQPLRDFYDEADVVVGIGVSFVRHPMVLDPPVGKRVVHITTNADDLNADCDADCPIIGDAAATVTALIEEVRGRTEGQGIRRGSVAALAGRRAAWLAAWEARLRSSAVPVDPYRVVGDLCALDPTDLVVTHDSGSPRDQLLPFFRANRPHGYIGWGRSHALGSGLGLAMGVKLARPEKTVMHVMGDAAFGMVGLDFETAVREEIPIVAVVLNNSTMAIETETMAASHARYRARDLGGAYADLARAMGGWACRVEAPDAVGPALADACARAAEGQAVLVEVLTSPEMTPFSCRRGARERGVPPEATD